ncbi:hypothetical protein OAY_03705 [Vibrio cyclitrophicus ZF205]|uniref:antiviral reverse transcriptase Drt3b n=1 Tax=Vibrio cyclitrophicus TaxID=47951 RepID=UPI000305D967|nr:antiviral reverse transcriptase Drt3b [Vibrio cyclitrophicus]OEE17609.1 hypothetical protein OAY_03705 [Vibrio cyclitrophicus ZF205]
MTSKIIQKEDYLRALVTDTSPFDLPIIISNEGIYDNLDLEYNDKLKLFLDKSIKKNYKPTDPIDFNISKTTDSVRRLSLPHPSAQYRMCQFYSQYSDLICYYTSISNMSIRSPKKIASTFYSGSNSTESKYKNDDIERDKTDFVNKHSISFFNYRGFNRIYKFFSSGTFYTLEKKYKHFWSMDVSKCFESIYSHSMSWATKSKSFIKSDGNYKNSALFGQELDKLMQLSNRNETNGIIVGPEFSRIFAEILFQNIDSIVEIKLKKINKLEIGIDYEIRRYIDDIFIFSNSKENCQIIFDRFSDELRKINLHVNESKTKRHERPFLTDKSRLILKLNEELSNFTNILYETRDNSIYLKDIYSTYNVSNRFIDRIKVICGDMSCTYDDVSNYLISSLDHRIRRVIDAFYEDEKKGRIIDHEEQRKLYQFFIVITDVMFHLYSVSYSVMSSYVISRSCLVIRNYLNDQRSDYLPSIEERIYNNIVTFSKAFTNRNRDSMLSLEVINLILITSEFGYEYLYDEELLKKTFYDKDEDLTYFNAVCLMFYIKKHPKYNNLRKELYVNLSNMLEQCSDFSTNSTSLHLLLDLVACPYVDDAIKANCLKKAFVSLHVKANNEEVTKSVEQLKKSYWFVNWSQINLTNLLEKKLLKSNY